MNDKYRSLRTWFADTMIRPFFRTRAMERLLLKTYWQTGWGFLLKLAPAHYSYPVGTFRDVVRIQIQYRVDISTYHGWMIYYYRSHNERIASLVKSGDTVVDIGANIGEIALTFARSVGATGRVVAFEPNPSTFEFLKGNRDRNPDLNLTVENVALGDRPGFVSMVLPDGRNPGTATIAPGSGVSGSCAVRVPVVTLDAYVDEHLPGTIHMIKIDVEGYESYVLEGAVSTLRRCRPILVVELCDEHQKRHGRSARLLVEHIMALGYVITRLEDGQHLPSLDHLGGCLIDIKCTPTTVP